MSSQSRHQSNCYPHSSLNLKYILVFDFLVLLAPEGPFYRGSVRKMETLSDAPHDALNVWMEKP